MTKRVALVTGGGRGIGRGIAERLLEDGWAVVIAEVDGARAEQTARELSVRGECVPVACDVGAEGDVARLAGVVSDRFGRLDALVNNAGHGAQAGDRTDA
ncbi:NAD(P)-dependent dehydrogenase (short-subunit alcohol dehydrogenase family) [Azospirillum soli]|nr:NAD(P)-dependent dehydrogenase (short-subunit alcohol dehydrogenase family) [Azospirillum soli]